MKLHPVEVELLHADRRTDGQTDRHDEANGHFSHKKAPNETEYLNPKPNITCRFHPFIGHEGP